MGSDPPVSEAVIISRHTYKENEFAPEQEQILALTVVYESLTLVIAETTDGRRTNEVVLDSFAGAKLLDALKDIYAEDQETS
jgi:hypothetical protein